MAKLKDRERALELRKKEMSYSQIKKALKVSKSTLSYWLRDYPLSKERIRELRDCNEQRIEKCRNTKRKKKKKRLEEFCKEQKKLIFPLNKREFYLSGLFLYWGEGTKTSEARISISNSNPAVISFFILWLDNGLNIPKNRLKIHLHLYKDMNINKEIEYWSNVIKISKKQFNKPYIKKTSSKRINHKGSFGHGTCNVAFGDARLSERIKMSIKAIADKYCNMGM